MIIHTKQGGMLLEGKLELTIGDETRIVESGSMFIIPPSVPHKAVAIEGPALVLDVFQPDSRGLCRIDEQVHSDRILRHQSADSVTIDASRPPDSPPCAGCFPTILFIIAISAQIPAVSSADEVDYLTQIKPLLAEKCFSCHGALKQESSLSSGNADR